MESVISSFASYDACLSDYADLKSCSELVWLLGSRYNIHNDAELDSLRKHIDSVLWFTYRKHFPEIGSSGLTSDFGWGCMHRCGQMVLAQAFMKRYLEKDWTWDTGTLNPTYLGILNKFNDTEESQYSVYNIAIRGNEMDKEVGQWFGPNTVAQVLKKLVSEDTETDIIIHIAMDNMVIKSEIKNQCKHKLDLEPEDNKSESMQNGCQVNDVAPSDNEVSSPQGQEKENISVWHPLLLIVPLRLGLSSISEKYFDKIKASFTLEGSLGILGGRTNHASYFIGCTGDELIFLDPHTTQQHSPDITSIDDSYHCSFPGRMSFSSLDPSVALCFYCDTEESFDKWCKESEKLLLEPKEDAIFEILDQSLPLLPYQDLEYPDDATCQSLAQSTQERLYTSDDEFELIW